MKRVRIGDLIDSISNWNPLRENGDTSFRYIDLSAVDQELKQITDAKIILCKEAPSRARQLVAEGDILVSTVRPNLNGVAKISTDLNQATASTGFCVLRPNVEKLDSHYLFHWVKSFNFVSDMVNKSTGASYPAVSDRIILDSLIPLPPLPEQRRIAAILDQADQLRVKRREALAELDRLTQSIFVEMFGDVMGEQSQWETQSLSNFIMKFESGKSVAADDEDDETSSYRVLKVSAVTSLEYRSYESKAAPSDYIPQQSYFVKSGDLLFSRANTTELIGATAFVSSTPENILLSDKLWRFVWHEVPRAEVQFVNYLFRQKKFREEIGRRASGTSGSMKNISQDKVLTIRVGLPPLELQQVFSKRIGAIEMIKVDLKKALSDSNSLFTSLQHRAFRGEL